jgi:hypothetical protein
MKDSLQGRSIFIAIPAYDGRIAITAAFALAQLILYCKQYGMECQMAHVSGCAIMPVARNTLVYEFMKSECTDLMFIDSDIEFNPKDVIKLLHQGSSHAIVGGVIPTRKRGAPYLVKLLEDQEGKIILDGDGLIEAEMLGTAFMLVRSFVFGDLIEHYPEWKYENEDGAIHSSVFDLKSTKQGYRGEDKVFCVRARKEGYRIWVDSTIKLNHFGQFKYEGNFDKDIIEPAIKNDYKLLDSDFTKTHTVDKVDWNT